ncbi:hypothetical protein [Spirillospora sp. NPDC047279]|uniref:hypothetical protein n=1 Tax=Spirillospora sp. NPDC047279 TaxID=3155478 RepID=UPI0033DAFE88
MNETNETNEQAENAGIAEAARAAAREVDYMDQVDVHPDVHRATESDEDQILRDLYGEPDDDGIFRADGEDS